MKVPLLQRTDAPGVISFHCKCVCICVNVCDCVTGRLTCAGLLVLVQSVSLVAVAGEDARRADADLFTVVFPLSTQVNG